MPISIDKRARDARLAVSPPRAGQAHRAGRWLRLGSAALLVALGSRSARAQSVADGNAVETSIIHIVFSSDMFSEVHENDAKAALKAWSAAFTRERHLRAEAVPVIAKDEVELAQRIAAGKANVLSVTMPEYVAIGAPASTGSVFVSVVNGRAGEEYVLLVHRDAQIASPAELAGRHLILHENTRTALAPYWLDVLLLEAGLAPARQHCERVEGVTKLNGAVLPVFFRQADACVVTRSGFEMLVEMNPQLGSHLRVLARSPEVMPAVGLDHPSPTGALRGVDLVAELRNLHLSAAGRQILTLFQTDRLTAIAPADLEPSRALLATHQRLSASWAAKHPAIGKTKAAALGGAPSAASTPSAPERRP